MLSSFKSDINLKCTICFKFKSDMVCKTHVRCTTLSCAILYSLLKAHILCASLSFLRGHNDQNC